jgi:hypothetical protein
MVILSHMIVSVRDSAGARRRKCVIEYRGLPPWPVAAQSGCQIGANRGSGLSKDAPQRSFARLAGTQPPRTSTTTVAPTSAGWS